MRPAEQLDKLKAALRRAELAHDKAAAAYDDADCDADEIMRRAELRAEEIRGGAQRRLEAAEVEVVRLEAEVDGAVNAPLPDGTDVVERLPDELLAAALLMLPMAETFRAARVSKRWHQVVHSAWVARGYPARTVRVAMYNAMCGLQPVELINPDSWGTATFADEEGRQQTAVAAHRIAVDLWVFASDERRPASSGLGAYFDSIFRLAGVDASGKVVNCRRRTYYNQSEETLALCRADASSALDIWESGSPAAKDEFSIADWTWVPDDVGRSDVGAVALSAAGDVIYVADGLIGRRPWKQWNDHSKTVAGPPTIRAIALRGAGESTDVGHCDQPLRVFRAETGPGCVTALALSGGAGCGRLYSAECLHEGLDKDNDSIMRTQIRCWCIETASSLYVISSTDEITGLSLANSGGFLIATCGTCLLVWAGRHCKFSSNSVIKCTDEALGGDASSTAITFNGRRVYAGTHSGAILAFAPKDGKLVQTMAPYRPEMHGPARGNDRGARGPGRRVGHRDWVNGLAMAPNELFSCSRDNTIQCWASDDGTHLRTIPSAHFKGVFCIAVAAGCLISGADDRSVRFWRTTDGFGNEPVAQAADIDTDEDGDGDDLYDDDDDDGDEDGDGYYDDGDEDGDGYYDDRDEHEVVKKRDPPPAMKVEPTLILNRVTGNRSEEYDSRNLWRGRILLSADGNRLVTIDGKKDSIRVWTW